MAEEFLSFRSIETIENSRIHDRWMEEMRRKTEENSRKHDLWVEEMRQLIGWPKIETPETRRITELSKDHNLWMEEMCRLLGLPKPEAAQSHRAVMPGEGRDDTEVRMETIHGGSVTEVQPDGLNVTPSHCKLAFNSRNDVKYKDHQSYIGNLCKDVAIDELKGLGVNENVDLGKSVIEVHELKVFDEMPRSNLSENEMLQLSDTFSLEDLRSELMSLKQTGDVKEYSDRFDKLLNCLSLNDSFALSCFLGGLRTAISSTVRKFKPKTLLEALSLAKLQERALMLNPQIHVAENCEVLKASAENEKSNVCEVVAENCELKLRDEMSEESTGEDVALQLSKDETELQVFDQKPKKSLDEKDREGCSDETTVGKFACCRKNLHKIEECETVPKVENENFNNTSLETMKFKLDARVLSHVGHLHYKSMEPCFPNEYEQMTEIDGVDKSENWWCSKQCSSMPIFGSISVEGQNFIVVGILSQESELLKYHMKELEKDDIKEYIRNNYKSMLLSEIKEFHVTYEMVRKRLDVAWANGFKNEGIRFIMINISPTLILLLKAYLESDGKNSFLEERSELERPPPEPPPRSLVLVHVMGVGRKLDKAKCIAWIMNKGLAQFSVYAFRPKYPHSNPWSLRTRTILRGWICYDPFLLNYLIKNIHFLYRKVLVVVLRFLRLISEIAINTLVSNCKGFIQIV